MHAAAERQLLAAALAALEDPARAASLPADDPDLLAVARFHRLTPLLAATCAETLPATLLQACRRDRVLTTARNLLLEQAAEECLLALAKRGIDGVLLKGLAYEPFLYGRVGCRPTADVDLLVRDRHRRAAFETLSSLGFEPRAAAPGFDEPDYHEVAWTRGNVELDLHLALAPLARCTVDYDGVWSGVTAVSMGQARAHLLAPPHAAVFHALHMAIDHFHVPAIYLVDLARLLPAAADVTAAQATARAWHCERALATSLALAAAFLPASAASNAGQPAPASWKEAARVVAAFGPTGRLPRIEQLRRKLSHIDTPGAALRYMAIQARRNVRELVETRIRHRSPRARLAL